jgi:hypothetical protein
MPTLVHLQCKVLELSLHSGFSFSMCDILSTGGSHIPCHKLSRPHHSARQTDFCNPYRRLSSSACGTSVEQLPRNWANNFPVFANYRPTIVVLLDRADFRRACVSRVPGLDQDTSTPFSGAPQTNWSILTSPPVDFRSILKNKGR